LEALIFPFFLVLYVSLDSYCLLYLLVSMTPQYCPTFNLC